MQRFERNVGVEAHTMIGLLNSVKLHYGDTASYLNMCGGRKESIRKSERAIYSIVDGCVSKIELN